MSNKPGTIFGIDLGTTYSCIAYVDEHGKPVVVPNQENQRVTPSVVFFDEQNIVVGDIAKENAKVYPDDVAAFVKRSMGDPHFEFVHGDQVFKPEDISSIIIKKLVQDAEQNLGKEIEEVVITCPAYFGINERTATRLAGEIAGLKVRQIINEPTAAAIAYGMGQDDEKVVLVFDLGGGTFDITMISVSKQVIEVICTGGDHNLGGKDWDDKIVRHLAAAFSEETGISEDDIFADAETRQDLVLSAERAKKTLSQRSKAPFSVTHGGERVKVELSLAQFEDLSRDLLEKTISLTQAMLVEAGKKGHANFDEILLVGGSTRMPQVAAAVEQAFQIKPKLFDPDEAVAKGAALAGWRVTLNDAVLERVAEATGTELALVKDTPFQEIEAEVLEQASQEVADASGFTLGAVKSSQVDIKDVCSKSFGIVAFDKDDVERVFNLVLKNTTVAVDVTKEFGTREDNQESVELRVMENELSDQVVEQESAVEIGMAILELPPNLPALSPLEVNFVLNEEGRLDMTARELKEGRTIKITIETNCVIHGEELELAKARSKSLVIC